MEQKSLVISIIRVSVLYKQFNKAVQLYWIGAYLESSTTILLIIGGMMYYITYILRVTTCFGFQLSHLRVTITLA